MAMELGSLRPWALLCAGRRERVPVIGVLPVLKRMPALLLPAVRVYLGVRVLERAGWFVRLLPVLLLLENRTDWLRRRKCC
ncbi:hypothetical protein ACFFK0_00640 [Paenibacillus chartarius]|uniref:Uncharacterized protein n=1 Tax=Paenibacillus chartarius TaxID=747481 RepID=A0ABV6DEC4_9BACL